MLAVAGRIRALEGQLQGVWDGLTELRRVAARVWKLEAAIEQMSDAQLQQELEQLRHSHMSRRGQPGLSSISPSLAISRELSRRRLGLRPHDEQIMGAAALHRGSMIEMANGEGKTLTVALAAAVSSLTGSRVHIATYNDYLARRDAVWMGPLYRAMGVSVGVLLPLGRAARLPEEGTDQALIPCNRAGAYACDVVYGQHRDFPKDYLDDASVKLSRDLAQSALDFIILDEADAALLDLARHTFQNISAYAQSPEVFRLAFSVASQLSASQDFSINRRAKAVELSEAGITKIQNILDIDRLFSVDRPGLAFHIIESLRAITFLRRDQDYVLSDGVVIPIDENTGRMNIGAKFHDGLQQAIEVKEKLEQITALSSVDSLISYQHFFMLYSKMSGLTATAYWRANEFRDVYGMRVIRIPTHRPVIRKDFPDLVFNRKTAKLNYLIDDIVRTHHRGQPVLVGTLTIEEAEEISALLSLRRVSHNILHAKYHEREAEIIKAAGQMGAVTVAAKMAGRGTDIVLGPGATELGGLYVIGADRAESRHIDMHLAGRAGRQGDPGASRFYTSLDSDLMLRFGGSRISSLMDVLGLEDDVALEHSWVTAAIRNAQRKVESYRIEERKTAYEADSAIDGQRRLIYGIRRQVLHGQVDDLITEILRRVVRHLVDRSMPTNLPRDQWNLYALIGEMDRMVGGPCGSTVASLVGHSREDVADRLLTGILGSWDRRRQSLGADRARLLSDVIVRQALDDGWRRHLARLNSLQAEWEIRQFVDEDSWAWYANQANRVFAEMLPEVEGLIAHLLFRT